MKSSPITMYASDRPNAYFPHREVALEDSLEYALEQHLSKFSIDEDRRKSIASHIRCNAEDLFQILKEYRYAKNDLEILRLTVESKHLVEEKES